MTCYHPLKAWYTGEYTEDGKLKYKITSDQIYSITLKDGRVSYDDYIEVPCGYCIGCRLDHSREWAIRCMAEATMWNENYFITLTYDNDHIPKDNSIHKRDLQLFLKRLRKEIDDPGTCRYFACGEYGETTFRPHYHLILFNCPIGKYNERFGTAGTTPTFINPIIGKCWPYGQHLIGTVTDQSAGYVARYNMKSVKYSKYEASDWQKLGIERPFLIMSRRPGIGYEFFRKNTDMFESDQMIVSTIDGGIKSKIPRYFEKLYEDEEHLKLLKIRRRSKAEETTKAEERNTDKNHKDYLKDKERVKKNELHKRDLGIP